MANFYGDLANQVGSDDESQISDVDPSQLAKMVEVSIPFFHKSWSAMDTIRLYGVKVQNMQPEAPYSVRFRSAHEVHLRLCFRSRDGRS